MAVVTEEIEKKTPATVVRAQVKAAPQNSEVATPDYDDPRFAEAEAEAAMLDKEVNDTYDGMLENSDQFYNKQIDETKAWEDKQLQLQQDSTDFAIEKIEQQKAEAQKDYVKEQSGAYTDWQKQINPYGTDAEKKASNGLTNTGYSESSQVAMYNAYQNRVAVARESMNKAMLDYTNAINEAMLQNNLAKAEIAFQSLQQRLELSLQGFQNRNNLLLDKFNTKLQVKQYNDSRWQTILDNIYREQTFGLQKEQFGLQKEQFEYGKAQGTKNNALNLILSGVGNEQLYKEAGLSFELGEALKNSFVSDREKLNLDLADQKLALEREDAGTLLTLAQMGIKVPLTEGLKKMGITQSMLDGIIEKANAVSVSSGGGSGSYENEDEAYNETPITKTSASDNTIPIVKPTIAPNVPANADQKFTNYLFAPRGGGSSDNSKVEFPSYDELIVFMIEEGVPETKAKKMMTKSEWGRSRKAEGTTKDQSKSTYEDYVANYIDNCLKQKG